MGAREGGEGGRVALDLFERDDAARDDGLFVVEARRDERHFVVFVR